MVPIFGLSGYKQTYVWSGHSDTQRQSVDNCPSFTEVVFSDLSPLILTQRSVSGGPHGHDRLHLEKRSIDSGSFYRS